MGHKGVILQENQLTSKTVWINTFSEVGLSTDDKLGFTLYHSCWVMLKAYYSMKVGLVDLSTHGGKMKFEFLFLKIQI